MFILTDFCGGKDNLIINTDKLGCEFYSEYIAKDQVYVINIRSKDPRDSNWHISENPILSGLYESEVEKILDKLNSRNNRQFVRIQNGEEYPLKYMGGVSYCHDITIYSKDPNSGKDMDEISAIWLEISSHGAFGAINVIYSNLHRIIDNLIEGYNLYYNDYHSAVYDFKRIINALNDSYYPGGKGEISLGDYDDMEEYRI